MAWTLEQGGAFHCHQENVPWEFYKINSGLTMFEGKFILECASLNANGFEDVLRHFLSQWNLITTCYFIIPLLCHVSRAPRQPVIRIILLIFQCLKHGSLFVGDKANHYVKAFLKSVLSSWCLHVKRFWTIKYRDCLLKYPHMTWQKKFICSLSPLMNVSQGDLFC